MNAAYAGAPQVVELLLKREEIDVNASDNVSCVKLVVRVCVNVILCSCRAELRPL